MHQAVPPCKQERQDAEEREQHLKAINFRLTSNQTQQKAEESAAAERCSQLQALCTTLQAKVSTLFCGPCAMQASAESKLEVADV